MRRIGSGNGNGNERRTSDAGTGTGGTGHEWQRTDLASRRGKDRRRWWCSVGARVRRSGVRSMRRRSGRWRSEAYSHPDSDLGWLGSGNGNGNERRTSDAGTGTGTVGSRSHVAVSPGATCVPPAIPYRSDRNNWGGARRHTRTQTQTSVGSGAGTGMGMSAAPPTPAPAPAGLSLGASMPRSEQRRGWRRSSRRGKDRRRWWCSVGARVRRIKKDQSTNPMRNRRSMSSRDLLLCRLRHHRPHLAGVGEGSEAVVVLGRRSRAQERRAEHAKEERAVEVHPPSPMAADQEGSEYESDAEPAVHEQPRFAAVPAAPPPPPPGRGAPPPPAPPSHAPHAAPAHASAD
jgi:hypothetical protein